MSYNYQLLVPMIFIIGVSTFIIRYIFLIVEPRFSDHVIIKRGMRAIPAAMLVALVVPFTFLENKVINPFRMEVYAILLTIPLVLITKKYGYGLIFALLIFIVLSMIDI